jgi:thimet oligopeptidase
MSDPTSTFGELPFTLTDAELTGRVAAVLDRARDRLAALEVGPAPRTAENLLRPLDAVLLDVTNLGSHCGFLFVTHPDAGLRDAGRRGSEATERFLSEFRTRRLLYDAIRSVDPATLEADGRHAWEKLLREMRRGGVELSDTDRTRFLTLSDEIEGLTNKFQQNTSDLVRSIRITDPAELAGLPPDFIAAHPAAADGTITLTTRYPDSVPVLSYAERSDVRRRMMTEFLLRAYPENMPVLSEVLQRRFEYARLLGYPTYADYALEDRMMGTRAAANEFIGRLDGLVRAPSQQHVARVLERKRRDAPSAVRVDPWDGGLGGSGYYEVKLRQEEFGVDLKRLREFLPYTAVRDGLLHLCERLFSLTISPVPGAEVWHPTVEAYDVTRGGKRFGRFYLDLVPREGKYTHAAQFNVRIGIEGVQLPQPALVCNFVDAKTPKESARMEYGDVVTFFHEFGHLLHSLFSGHGPWLYNTQGFIEWDFVEAPSQLFEEWAHDPDVLATFARRPETGEPIPRELLDRLKAAEGLGRASSWQFQTALAAASLGYYDRDPSTIDPETAFQTMSSPYLTVPRPQGSHLEAAWGHLMGYSACYYTYAWSLVIARDFLGQFIAKGSLVDPELAARYAETILAPGSSRPAHELVEAFLGRAFDYRAFEQWVLTNPYDTVRSDSPANARVVPG